MSQVEIVKVPTRILTDKDDIVEAIDKFAAKVGGVGPDDVVSVAESVVAVTQGMAVRPEDLKISVWARIFCRVFPDIGSLSTPHGLQALFDVEGTWRVIGSLAIGLLAMPFKRGVFYELAGYQAALIDDVTGTMPPFDKHVVYGPKEPQRVVEAIRNHFGCYGAMIADANDLHRCRVVGASKGLEADEAAKLLLDNPFGNASQKVPVVIIRDFGRYIKSKQNLEKPFGQ